MTLIQYFRCNEGTTPTDYYETYIGLRPVSNAHPPSLRNPTDVHIAKSTDGWHKGDSKAARQQAQRDLVEILKRGQRQIGKPTIAHTAIWPVFPGIDPRF